MKKAQPLFFNHPHFREYWNSGNGKELLDWANISVNIRDFDQYAHLYHEIDELADETVKETYLKLPYPEAYKLIRLCSGKNFPIDPVIPESVNRLFLQMREVPAWFNPNLANKGARLCMRTGTNALIVLRDFTLMGGYDYAFLNKPLIFTGALKKGAVKRLKDTLEFWIGVTRENALEVGSDAYQLIVRTRLMHSYARLNIQQHVQNWDFERWGSPLNFWDMIATYTGFSLVFLQGLKKLGIKISEEEESGLFHLWKYVGYLLGIPEPYLPENRQQAVRQLYLWSATQDKADGDSAQLAKALLDENIENTIYKYQFQRKLLLNLHQSMNWFMLDPKINARLGIQCVSMAKIFPYLVVGANRITQQIFNPKNEEQYQKLVSVGNRQQLNVLRDYMENTP